MSIIERIPLKTITKEQVIGQEYEMENLTQAVVENFINNLKTMQEKIKKDRKIHFSIEKHVDFKDCNDDIIIAGADYLINFKLGSKDENTLFQLAFKYGDLLSGGGIVQHIFEERIPPEMNVWDINALIKNLVEYMYKDQTAIQEDNPLCQMNTLIQQNLNKM